MDPIVSRSGDSFRVPPLLNELLHVRHRSLSEHVQQQADDRGDKDDCDRDRHWVVVVCFACCGEMEFGSTMYVLIVFALPSYLNCTEGIGSGFVSSVLLPSLATPVRGTAGVADPTEAVSF